MANIWNHAQAYPDGSESLNRKSCEISETSGQDYYYRKFKEARPAGDC